MKRFIKKLVKFIKQYTLQDFLVDLKYLVLPNLLIFLGWFTYIVAYDIYKYGL